MKVHFEKISRFDRKAEPSTFAVPFARGTLVDSQAVSLRDGRRSLPVQARATANWPDGSVKWLLIHTLVDLPGNSGADFELVTGELPDDGVADETVQVLRENGVTVLDTGPLQLTVTSPGESGLFSRVVCEDLVLEATAVQGPWLCEAGGRRFLATVDDAGWQVVENGPVRAVLQAHCRHVDETGTALLDGVIQLYAWAGKPWVEVSYRLINREETPQVALGEIALALQPKSEAPQQVRTALAHSNYRTVIRTATGEETLSHLFDADFLIYQSNEQVPETLYGTFWADWNDPVHGGVCVTIHQAQQNYPKELSVAGDGTTVGIWPQAVPPVTLFQGVAPKQRLLLHFHGPDTPLEELNIRSLQYQMPDRARLAAETYAAAGVFPDTRVAKTVPRVEHALIMLADQRTRGYGMLNWGDGPDAGYTNQGRGHGEPVWTNGEYDPARAAMLLYARTGERRMLDYMLVFAEHCMDVDVCHHSENPLRHGGQIVHSAHHVTGGVTVSHEWVEGLLDYYHHTGEEFALKTALGIGENVLRHLQQPHLQQLAGAAARETGWALRTLVALHEETHDPRWMAAAERIVDQFAAWQEKYGAWLAPYTDHTLARVPFMIAVAVNSLMCYYSVRPEERVRQMVICAMEDLLEHCLMPDGVFYYKELPSLQKRGAGVLTLEALAHAYDLTSDPRYLHAGLPMFEQAISGESRLSVPSGSMDSGPKFKVGEDTVIWPGGRSPKGLGAVFPGLMQFYRTLSAAGLVE